MKAFFRFITSIPFMALLFMVLAFSLATATFVESSYGTSAAKALIYNTHWFELLWGLLALNLLNNIVKYKLFSRKRFTLGVFHAAFLAMMAGALITRYLGFEGTMHIRENESSDFIVSSDIYFYSAIGDESEEKKVLFSEIATRKFTADFGVNGQNIKVKPVGFIKGAERKAIPSDTGEPVIDLVCNSPEDRGMQSVAIVRGNTYDIYGIDVSFNGGTGYDIQFYSEDEQLFMSVSDTITETSMAGSEGTVYAPGDTIPVKTMFLYSLNDFRFLIRTFYKSASFTAVKSGNGSNEDAVIVRVTDGDRQHTVPVFGHSGVIGDTVEVPLENGLLKLTYGSKYIHLPFSLHLNDFRVDRYPGSDSPSSFASDVVLIDNNENLKKDLSIFMNNTLRYKKYKFFQSSYDRDEKGTILSVNHDYWGTSITYLGYALLTIGIILSLLNRNSYFRILARRLKQYSVKGSVVLSLFFVLTLTFEARAQTIENIPVIDNQVVKKYSELWIQGVDGRIEPVSTLSGEIVRKISRKASIFGKSADEVVLSMSVYPDLWRTVPFIRVANKSVAGQLGITGKHISLQQLFDEKGNYILAEDVRNAYNKAPALRNRIEKELINIDERVSICFMLFRGSIFRFFPGTDKEQMWYTPGMAAQGYIERDSVFIKNMFNMLVSSLSQHNKNEAIGIIDEVTALQNKYGVDILPSDGQKKVEIMYNKINPFERIFPYYMLSGFLLLSVLFINIFRMKDLPNPVKIFFQSVIVLIFIIHTAGIIARWYISGHAPWSNGYESVVYVAWAAMFAGLLFGKRYPMVLGTASFLAGISLFVAHLSWMNPEITNLVPVLKSYWLTIHVSVITSSYGFLGLSAFLGILVLILMIIRRSSNEQNVNIIISQLTNINQISAIAGLYFLTIGSFFGAIWANESWGRYWGWDPKETWSLITIIIYAFIVHMRLIPQLRGEFNFNFASVLGFGSVLMTYFGVNYYLTGLHSYGQGSADKISPVVPLLAVSLAVLIIWSYIRDNEYEKGKLKISQQNRYRR